MTEALHIVCPHCHTTNRVQAADLAKAPDCGQCHQPLFAGHPVALDEASFERHVGRSQIPVLVDFWAPWCGPCKMVSPMLDRISAEQGGKLIIAKVNTDEDSEWASKYGVQGIPLDVMPQDRESPVPPVIVRLKSSKLARVQPLTFSISR